MTIPSAYYMPVPPAFSDDPLLYAWSMSGFMVVVMISLEWTHRVVWALIDHPEPFRHPRTMKRLVVLGILFSILLRNAPDVVQSMMWQRTDPATRYAMGYWNRIGDGISIWPMVVAWFLSRFAEPVIDFQLGRKPIAIELFTKWRELKRPLTIVGISIFICFVVAYHG